LGNKEIGKIHGFAIPVHTVKQQVGMGVIRVGMDCRHPMKRIAGYFLHALDQGLNEGRNVHPRAFGGYDEFEMPPGYRLGIPIQIVFVYSVRIEEFRLFRYPAFVFLGKIFFYESLMPGDIFSFSAFHDTLLPAGQSRPGTIQRAVLVTVGTPAKKKL
jgi:hypothetical protein